MANRAEGSFKTGEWWYGGQGLSWSAVLLFCRMAPPVLWLLVLLFACATATHSPPAQIRVVGSEQPELSLAAKELRRYVYATSGAFPAIVNDATAGAAMDPGSALNAGVLVMGTIDDLVLLDGVTGVFDDAAERLSAAGSDAHGRVSHPSGATVLVGATPLAVLYAAYDWASSDLGVYFAIDGDRIPRKKAAGIRNAVNATASAGLSKPRFVQRGAVP